MSLQKTVKSKTLAFKATDEFHEEVKTFCDARMWNMSKFLEQAIRESMEKVLKKDRR